MRFAPIIAAWPPLCCPMDDSLAAEPNVPSRRMLALWCLNLLLLCQLSKSHRPRLQEAAVINHHQGGRDSRLAGQFGAQRRSAVVHSNERGRLYYAC